MKRIFSLILAIVMLASAFPAAHAVIWTGCQNCENPLTLCPDCNLDTYCPDCDICESCGYETPDNNTNDHTAGTLVVFEATNNESYTITVPAKLNPGQSGLVTLAGSWSSNKTVSVTAEPTVTLTNSILSSDQKVLDITFLGIYEAGNDTTAKTYTETISVDGIENALFGTWSGKFDYNVDMFLYDNVFPIQWNTKEVAESNNPKFTAAEMPFVKISDLTPDAESITNPTGSFESLWQNIPMGIAYSVDGLTMYINTEGGIPFPLIIAYKAGEYEYEEELVTITEPGMYFIDVYQHMDEWDDNCTFATN